MLRFVRKIHRRSRRSRSPQPPGAIDRRNPIWRLVIALAWPVLAQQLLILSVSISDAFLAGYYEPSPPEERAEAIGHRLLALGMLGGQGQPGGMGRLLAAEAAWQAGQHFTGRHIAFQSAQTTAQYLSWFFISYTVLVNVGSTALVARFIGAGDRERAIHVTNQSILLALTLGILGGIGGLLGVQWLVEFLRLRAEAAELAAAYLRPLFLLLVFQMVGSAGVACLTGAGDTRTGFWVLGGVAVLNLPLAWMLFHGIGAWPGFGFEGIAYGTAISQMLGGLAVLVMLARGRAGLRLAWDKLRPNWNLLSRLLRVSVPAGFDSLSLMCGQFWFLSIVNRLGDVASSAHGIALRWEALGYLSGTAFGTAAMTLVGQNLGARRPDQAARSGWVAFGMGSGVMCLMAAVFFVLAPQMFALFCPNPEQQPVVEAGVPVLRLVAFAMPAIACWGILSYALRGAGDTRVPVLFTWFGFLGVRIPLAYWFTQPEIHLGPLGTFSGGLFGAWVAMFADLMVRGVFFLVRFAGGRWKRIDV